MSEAARPLSSSSPSLSRISALCDTGANNIYHNLLTSSVQRAKPATRHEMTQFHTDEYIDFLQKVTPDNMDNFAKEQGKYNVGDDCPVFDGLFDFCGISAGGSMEGAARLNRGKCDIAINWAGVFITPRRVKQVASATSTVRRRA